MGLETLDPRNREDVKAVADLHRRHLAESPVAQLGDRFMRDFYYSRMIQDGLFGCTICRVDGTVGGFISYTADATGFMGRGLRRHFIRLCWLIGFTVLTEPRLVGNILFVLRIMRARRSEGRQEDPRGLGEAISMVVLPEFQNHVPPGGTSRLAVRLFLTAADEIRRLGGNRVQVQVQPSNRSANLFYNALGCSFERRQYAGTVIHRYVHYLPSPAAANDLGSATEMMAVQKPASRG